MSIHSSLKFPITHEELLVWKLEHARFNCFDFEKEIIDSVSIVSKLRYTKTDIYYEVAKKFVSHMCQTFPGVINLKHSHQTVHWFFICGIEFMSCYESEYVYNVVSSCVAANASRTLNKQL